MRGAPAAAGELTNAVEPGEQGLAVERYRGRWPIEGGSDIALRLSDADATQGALTRVVLAINANRKPTRNQGPASNQRPS